MMAFSAELLGCVCGMLSVVSFFVGFVLSHDNDVHVLTEDCCKLCSANSACVAWTKALTDDPPVAPVANPLGRLAPAPPPLVLAQQQRTSNRHGAHQEPVDEQVLRESPRAAEDWGR